MGEPTKQATVFIVDVGASTGECHNGRVESDLTYGMHYVWEKIAEILALNRKGLSVGVLGLRHDETSNPMGNEEGYENIAVLKELDSIQMSHLAELQRKIKPSSTRFGDAISAIVVAVHIIEKATTLKTGKLGAYKRSIVLLTDGRGPMDGGDIDPIVQKINEIGVDLTVVGIDFDDLEFGFKEEDKEASKRNNEELLRSLVEKCDNGMIGTAAEAIQSLSTPKVKTTRIYKGGYKGKLSLGDYKKYPDTALYIDVERYFRTKQAKPVGASSFVTRSNGEPSGQSSHTMDDVEMTDAPDLSAVKSAFTYTVKDPSGPGGKKHVERDELAKGYMYGSTAVPINESEENVTKLETFQSFEIIGFIHKEKYEIYLNMGESCLTVAQRVNDKAVLAFSSLIHALHELDSYVIARIVSKDGNQPQIIVMAPSIENDMEALVDIPIPFAEDVRVYRFPPLDRVITISGATMTKHRNLPNDDLIKAMDDYVDSMDLSSFGQDDDGEPTEYMPIEDTYSPAVHRINQAIRTRAVQPDKPIDPPAEVLMQWSKPPEKLVKKTAEKLKKLVEAADVKKVEPKAKGRRYREEQIAPLSGLDVTALLSSEKPHKKISMDNSIPDFKQWLASAESEAELVEAAEQMATIIQLKVKQINKEVTYEVVVATCEVMRDQLIRYETPDHYNDFIRDLKKKLEAGELLFEFGEKREFMWRMRKAGLGLINSEESHRSEVSKEEGDEFWSVGANLPSRPESSEQKS